MGEKFKEFYFTGDQRLHNLDELEKEYEQKSGDISSYRGRIFCPECRIAELAFTHKTSKKKSFFVYITVVRSYGRLFSQI